MTIANLRIAVTWHLLFAALIVIALSTYYPTLDGTTILGDTTNAAAIQQAHASGWLGDHFSGLHNFYAQWTQVREGLSTVLIASPAPQQ